jgi:hypothetical protein
VPERLLFPGVCELAGPVPGFGRTGAYFERAPTITSQQQGETLASSYGLGPVPEWRVEDLKARYNLKLLGE